VQRGAKKAASGCGWGLVVGQGSMITNFNGWAKDALRILNPVYGGRSLPTFAGASLIGDF